MLKQAQRKAIESRYVGKCDIKVKKEIVDPETNITQNKDVIIVKDEPCRLSYSHVPTMKSNENADEVKQIIKLFIKPEIDIPAGCRIVVTQHNKTNSYRNSGFPEVHTSHQEIMLELDDKFGRL